MREVAERIFAAGYDDDLIVQEYIEGDESVMRVANTYSDRNAQLTFVSVGQVVLADHDPSMVGNNNAILAVDDPDLAASLGTLLNAVGYTGSANFDVMHDRRDGVSKVLELNLRQGATSYYAMAAGGNIPARIVQDWVYGEPIALRGHHSGTAVAQPALPARGDLRAARAALARACGGPQGRQAHAVVPAGHEPQARSSTCLRVDLRYALSTIKYARRGMNR